VAQDELGPLTLDLVIEPGVARMLLLELGEKRLVATPWHLELFVEKHQHAGGLLLDKIEDNLVVNVIGRLKRDLLCFIEFFFKLECVLVEMLLKLLVCLAKKSRIDGNMLYTRNQFIE